MKDRVSKVYHGFGLPRLIISAFLLTLIIVAAGTELSVPGLLSDALVRIGQNGIYVLAMVPSIQAGAGLNFGLPLGVIAGMVAYWCPWRTLCWVWEVSPWHSW